MKRARLLIDVQSYFLDKLPSSTLVSDIAQHVKNTQYDAVVFTVFRNQPMSNFQKSLQWNDCTKDSDTVIPDSLLAYAKEPAFERCSYNAFKNTDLSAYLNRIQINELSLCGIDTDACVLATAFAAFDEGYRVKAIEELTASIGSLKTEALTILKRNIEYR